MKDCWPDKNIHVAVEFSHQIEKKMYYALIMIPTKLHISALNCETLMNRVRMGNFVRVSLPGSC